jgi:hypothetical protein
VLAFVAVNENWDVCETSYMRMVCVVSITYWEGYEYLEKQRRLAWGEG